MLSVESIDQYSYTAGILLAFAGMIAAAIMGRMDIAAVFRELKLRRRDVIYALAIVLLFVVVEFALVKPTQQLFFDDVINQGMAQQLLNSGQAWMCNYGTPGACYQGDIFHEPMGPAFNIAMGFLLFGISRNVAYGVGVSMAAISVAMTFLVAFLIFRDAKAALFSELLMALSPILLIWAMPTQSDIYLMGYSLIALFFMGIFRYRKGVLTFAMLAFSLALATYMKVDGFILVPVIALMYVFTDGAEIRASVRRNIRLLEQNMLNTRFLIVLLVFVLAITPAFLYTTNEAANGDYGAAGGIQNTCNNFASGTVQGTFNLQNFEYNLCGNVLFWFDSYQSQYIIVPPFFTLMAIIGVFAMAMYSRNTALALGTWFLAFFLLYCAFYAGSVNYGVDWRFQLNLMPSASMFAGFGCAAFINAAANRFRRMVKPGDSVGGAGPRHLAHIAMFAVLALIALSIILLIPDLSIQPYAISQAADARFYENFVYNSSAAIPQGCIVFSYDPEIYMLNGRASRQLSDIYDPAIFKNMSEKYPCMVVDQGYWCYTPNSLCTNLNQSFILSPIMTDEYVAPKGNYPQNKTFGFYLVKGARNQ